MRLNDIPGVTDARFAEYKVVLTKGRIFAWNGIIKDSVNIIAEELGSRLKPAPISGPITKRHAGCIEDAPPFPKIKRFTVFWRGTAKPKWFLNSKQLTS